LFITVAYFTLNYIESYTQHQQTHTVPQLVGVNLNSVYNTLDTTKFKIQVVDSVFDRKLKGGAIVIQKPEAEQQVKMGRTIYLTIAARTKKRIKLYLDNIVGGSSTTRAALDNLSSYDVVVDSIQFVDYQYDNIVLGVLDSRGKEIKSGALIYAGSKLILKVGRKGGTTIKLPDFSGKNMKDIQMELMLMQLNSLILQHDMYHPYILTELIYPKPYKNQLSLKFL
jgi:beta-lactam-binding protein with PASTA domain